MEEELPLKEGCFHSTSLGNDVCDDFANVEECAYDKGISFSQTVCYSLYYKVLAIISQIVGSLCELCQYMDV